MMASNPMKSWLEKQLRCQSKGNSRDGAMCEGCLLGNCRFQCAAKLNFIESGKKNPKVSVQISLANPEIFFFAGISAASPPGVKHEEVLPDGYCRGRWERSTVSGSGHVTKSRVGLGLLPPAPPSCKPLKSAVKSSAWQLKSADISRQRIMPQILD